MNIAKTAFNFLLIFFISSSVNALTIMEINTEFLWDHLEPHEGQIVGKKKTPPTRQEYTSEIKYYASLIHRNNADIVSLIEIEHCGIAKHVTQALNSTGTQWYFACEKGRDSFTGQDVALLSKTPFLKNSVTTFEQFSSPLDGKNVRPSKVVGAVTIISSGQTVAVIAAHLISKRGNNDSKRVAQARAIQKAKNALYTQHGATEAILMGDFNDEPSSKTLTVLKQNSPTLFDPSNKNDCSYIYKNQCQLIDHILITNGLSNGVLRHIDLPSEFSDHHALVYTL
jgi:predicted extracellular nuclease